MSRLFIALEIPNAIALKLSMTRGGVHGARWIDSDSMHITLRFFGDVSTDQERSIHSVLQKLEIASFPILIQGVDSFGGKRPRAIFATVRPSLPLLNFQTQLERYAQYMGFDPEHRKFSPHITLARLKQARHKDVGYFCMQHNISIREEFIATGFALYSARVSTGGGPYVVEERYDFLESSPHQEPY